MATENLTILTVGHNTKARAIGYLPLVIAGMQYIFNKRYLVGLTFLATGFGLELQANHVQITYYGGFMVVLYVLFHAYPYFKENQFKSFFVALIAITISTIWQKKLSNNLPLSVSNMYQAIGGCLFHVLIILFFVEPYINFSKTFFIAISHQIFLVSFGAFTILMYLIKHNSASKTVSVFFLIPPVSAIMAYLFLGENLEKFDIVGLILATIGVYIATRKNKNDF